MIVKIKTVLDRPSMEQYLTDVVGTFADTGAIPLSIYEQFRIVEGEGPLDGMVMVEFPDMEAANRWYDSPAYRAITHNRLFGADTEIIFLNSGIDIPLNEAMPHTKGRVRIRTT